MEVTQPFVVVLAFVAGFGCLLLTRLLWTLLTHSIHLLFLAGAIFFVFKSGYLRLDEVKGTELSQIVQTGTQWILSETENARSWFHAHELSLNVVPKQDHSPSERN